MMPLVVRCAPAIFLALLLVGTTSVPGQAPRYDQLGPMVIAAYRASDAAAFERIVANRVIDPHEVLDVLLGLHVEAALAAKKPDDALDAALRYARHCEKAKRSVGLAALATRWQALDSNALERERSVRRTWQRVKTAFQRKQLDEVIDCYTKESATIDECSWSPSRVRIYFSVGRTMHQAGRHGEAQLLFDRAAAASDEIGWPRMLHSSLTYSGATLARLERFGQTIIRFRRLLTLLREAKQTQFAARIAVNLAVQLHHFGEYDEMERLLEEALPALRGEMDKGYVAKAKKMRASTKLRRVARAVVNASTRGDRAALRDNARDPSLDGISIVGCLFMLHVYNTLRDPPRTTTHLDAASAFAEEAAKDPRNTGIEELVATWRAYSAEELQREGRLWRTSERIGLLLKAKAFAKALGAYSSVEEDMERAPPKSLAAATIHRRAAVAPYRMGDLKKTCAINQRALAACQRVPWPSGVAALHQALGAGHRLLNQPLRGIDAHTSAAAAWRALGNEGHAARSDLEAGLLYKRTGDYTTAETRLQSALETFRRLDDPQRTALALNALGGVYEGMGRMREAAVHHEEALTAWNKLGLSHRDRVLVPLAFVYVKLGAFTKAETCLEQVEKPGSSAALNARAFYLRESGQYAKALDLFEKALKAVRDLASPYERKQHRAAILQNIGHMYGLLHQDTRALRYYERAYESRLEIGDTEQTDGAVIAIGQVYARCRDYDTAKKWFGKVKGGGANASAVGSRIQLRLGLADCDAHLGLLDRALEQANAAREEAVEHGYVGIGLLALMQLGWIHRKAGDTARAQRVLDDAVAESRKLGVRWREVSALQQLAAVCRESGDLERTVALAREAFAGTQDLVRDLGDVAALPRGNHGHKVTDQALLAALAMIGRKSPGHTKAVDDLFWASEAGRSRLLSHGLVNRASVLDAHLDASLLGDLGHARTNVARLQQLVAAGDDKASAKMRGANVRLEHVIARIQREHHRLADVIYPEPVSMDKLTAALSENEAFISFRFTHTRALVLAVTRSASHVVDLGKSDELSEAVDAYHNLVTTPGAPDRMLAASLHDKLFGGLGAVLEGKTRLLISPDGPLNFLSFDALVCDAHGTRMIERFEIAYVPSASVYTTMLAEVASGPRGHGLLALADPTYPAEASRTTVALRDGPTHLARLAETAVEVAAIRGFFPDDRTTVLLRDHASIGGLERGLAATQTRLAAVHIACHGYVDTESPRFSGVVLAGGEMLTLTQLYCLRVPADLAVLSACATSQGELARGEGVLGLVRGFFFAGCPRVVVSNWPVRDRATRDLMEAFYRHMRTSGLAPATALRRAKLEMLRAGGDRAHPYFWAPFVLWGLAD